MSGLKHTLEVIEETIEKGLEAVHLKKKDVDAHKENGTVSVETENLAMPEIHLKKKEDKEYIYYSNILHVLYGRNSDKEIFSYCIIKINLFFDFQNCNYLRDLIQKKN